MAFSSVGKRNNVLGAHEQNRLYIGFMLLVLCVCTITYQSEVVPTLQKDVSYQKPYAIMWLAHSCFMVIYPIQMLYFLIRDKFSLMDYDLGMSSSLNSLFDDLQLTVREMKVKLAFRSFLFSLLFTLSTYFWYLAAGYTTPTRLVAISNTNICFAYAFEILLMGERLKVYKLSAVILSVVGVLIMSLLSFRNESGSVELDITKVIVVKNSRVLMGDLFTLASSILIGLSEVIYKKYLSPKDDFSLPLANLASSWIGFFTFSVGWLPLPILHFSGLEVFQLPSWQQWRPLLINAFCSVAFNCSFLPLLSVTGPVWSSIGVLFSVPLIAVVDWFFYNRIPSWTFAVGTALVLVSFIILLNDDFEMHSSEPVAKKPQV